MPPRKTKIVCTGQAQLLPRCLGRWLSYQRNLYREFQMLYGEEPRRLVKIGIINDTDQTGQEAVSYIVDPAFRRAGTVD